MRLSHDYGIRNERAASERPGPLPDGIAYTRSDDDGRVWALRRSPRWSWLLVRSPARVMSRAEMVAASVIFADDPDADDYDPDRPAADEQEN